MLVVSGSGNLQVRQLAATHLETALSGLVNVLLGGRCSSYAIRISGSGNALAHDLRTETSRVRLSGPGVARMHASRVVEAVISGSGNVFVAGGGQLNSTMRGSGRISKE